MPFFPLNPSQAADNTCWAAGLLMGLFLVISPSKPFADAEETFFFLFTLITFIQEQLKSADL